jgi:hypothetical protein
MEESISPLFIDALKLKGYKFINILGEGCFNIALKCLDKENNNCVLLIDKYFNYHRNKDYKNIVNMIDEGIINTDYIIKPITSIKLNNVYLYNNEDIKNNHFIEIQQYAEMTLKDKIKSMVDMSIDEKINILILLMKRLKKMLDYIHGKNLNYIDFNHANLVFINKDDINSLVFIDLESFKKCNNKNNNFLGKQRLESFLRIILYSDALIFKDKEEQIEGIKLYEKLNK